MVTLFNGPKGNGVLLNRVSTVLQNHHAFLVLVFARCNVMNLAVKNKTPGAFFIVPHPRFFEIDNRAMLTSATVVGLTGLPIGLGDRSFILIGPCPLALMTIIYGANPLAPT